MLSAVFAVLFAVSLLPGRRPLCLVFAERISDGIMPEGAETYCRRLTWVWLAVLACTAAVSLLAFLTSAGVLSMLLSPLAVALTFAVEGVVRARRFSVVFRTSGSTGRSKTVVKSFASLAREVAMHRAFYREAFAGLDGPVTVLSTVDPDHMYGRLWRVMLPDAAGFVRDDETILSPEALLAKMSAARHVMLVTTPGFLSRFARYADGYDVPRNCVEIVTSGSLLAADVSNRAREIFGVSPREIFGSTETGGVAWRRQSEFSEWRVFGPVRVGTAGARLAVRSPFSFRRRYVMGDGVELAADGRSFRLLGRLDRLVKVNGERVNLAEMEERVRALGYSDCALAALAGAHGTVLGAVLVAGPGAPAEGALAVRRRLLPVFPRGTVPRRFRFVAEVPRNAQGKVVADGIVRLLEEPK